jgi:hypothetical protein
MMKKILFLLFISFAITGCKKKLTQFYINYDSQITIPATLTQFLPIAINTPPITTNSTHEFEINSTKKEYIRSIQLSELQLTIESPSNETFSFLNTLEIFISSSGLPEKMIANKYNIADTVGTTIYCNVNDQDLQEYIKADNFALRVSTETDETIPQDVTVSIHSRYFVDAKLSKK